MSDANTENTTRSDAMMLHEIIQLILLFFTFSLIGWCIEVTLKYFQYHRFINRGFLTGPWLPIYGSGAVYITVAVNGISNVEKGVGTTFAISFILCGLWEYFISYYLEKKFHARWWDYSQKPMNLNGRVWIGNLILFGLGGVAIVHILNPFILPLFDRLSFRTQEIIAGILSVVFLADFVVSHFVMKLVKRGTESSEADNTEEISKEIRMLLSDKAFFYRRFADAYPDVIYRTEKIQARLEAIKAETERMRTEAEAHVAAVNQRIEAVSESVNQRIEEVSENVNARIEEGKAQLAYNLESKDSIKNTIIVKQDDLIRLLYNENTASPEAKHLMDEIEEQKARIESRFSLEWFLEK